LRMPKHMCGQAIYMCIYIYTCIYTNITPEIRRDHHCECGEEYVRAGYTYMYIHVCTYRYIYIHMYIYMCMYTHVYIYMCIYMYIHVYVYICIYIHVYIHTEHLRSREFAIANAAKNMCCTCRSRLMACLGRLLACPVYTYIMYVYVHTYTYIIYVYTEYVLHLWVSADGAPRSPACVPCIHTYTHIIYVYTCTHIYRCV